MKKGFFKFLSISTILCAGALIVGSLSSCSDKIKDIVPDVTDPDNGGGNTDPTPPGPGEDVDVPSSGTFETVVDRPKQVLSLSEELVVHQATTKHFAPHLVTKVGEGEQAKWQFVSNGGEALLTAGQEVHLQAYGVPEGWSLGCTVMDGMGFAEASQLQVGSDGKIIAPEVTEETEFLIYLYATAPTADLEFNGTKYADSVRKSIRVTVIPKEKLAASKIYKYDGMTPEERTEAAAALERFALRHGITGVTLSSNGGFQLYNERISAPLLDANRYLPGYGFGLDLYGDVKKPLEKEKTEAYKMYWHEWTSVDSDTGNFNFLNSSEAIVADYYNRVTSSYWYTPLNEDNTKYEYAGCLSRDNAPIPLDLDPATGLATKWKVNLRVGADTDGPNGETKGLTYRTNSQIPAIKAFDGRKVALEDYLTPLKLLATQSIGWFRGAEMAGEKTASRQIKGFTEWFNGSEKRTKMPTDEEFSSAVGASIDHSDNSITLQFNAGFSEDFGIYQLGGLWANPIPADFILALGKDPAADSSEFLKGASLYGTSPEGMTPLDTLLSVGPYFTESYQNKVVSTFAKNEDWFLKKDPYGRDIYKIKGYHVKASSSIQQDQNALITAWENGEVDSTNIPDEYWDKYLTDPRRKKIEGTRQQKLTFNTMDEALHNSLFGPGGMWHEKFNSTDSIPAWDVKPIRSNRNFFYGLNLAVDRVAFSDKYHVVPSIDYIAPVGKVTPMTTELYNSSIAHKEAISDIYGEALTNLEDTLTYAISYMETAIAEELEAGHYDLGTGEAPTIVNMVCGTIDDPYFLDRIALIAQNWKETFNRAVQTHVDRDGQNHWVDKDGKPRIIFKLITEGVPEASSQDELITKGLWAGALDIQYAYLITGNSYDVLNGMNILKSTGLEGFELNFGADTSIPSRDVYYDGLYWSFDSLWQATQGGAFIDGNGKLLAQYLLPREGEETAKPVTVEGSDVPMVEVTIPVDKAIEGFECEVIDQVWLAITPEGQLAYAPTPVAGRLSEDGSSIILTLPLDCLLPAHLLIDPSLTGFAYIEVIVQYQITAPDGTTAVYQFTHGMLVPADLGQGQSQETAPAA